MNIRNGDLDLTIGYLNLVSRLKDTLNAINIGSFKQELEKLSRQQEVLDINADSMKSYRRIGQHIDEILQLAEIAFSDCEDTKKAQYHLTVYRAISMLYHRLKRTQPGTSNISQQMLFLPVNNFPRY